MRTTHLLAYDPDVTTALKALPALGATDGDRRDRPAVKLFDAYGQAFWVIWEYDPDEELGFGYCELFPGGGEIGYVSVAELRTLGIRIERDSIVTTLTGGYRSRGLEPPDYLIGIRTDDEAHA